MSTATGPQPQPQHASRLPSPPHPHPQILFLAAQTLVQARTFRRKPEPLSSLPSLGLGGPHCRADRPELQLGPHTPC
ncbi:hypothetical protein H8959_006225 [Pygathrix nigripes]